MTFLKIKSALRNNIFLPYSTVFFCYSPALGFLFALISFFSPRTAVAGLFCLVCSWVWGKLLSIKPPGNLHLVNALLSGLFLSASYPLSASLFIGLLLLALFVTITVNWLVVYMWYLGRIPLMTLPFVLGTWLVIIAFYEADIISQSTVYFLNPQLFNTISYKWLNDFFSAIGGLMLVPYPFAGALMFLGLLIASRYLAFLVVSGYVVGVVILHLLGYDFLIVKSGYNCMLVALALGGIFMVPGVASYCIALGGSALSCLFIIALFKLFAPFLPILVMPFLLSTYFWIGGLGPRIDKNKGLLYLDFPISPEIAWDNARLAKVRGRNLQGLPIVKLFRGEWLVEFNSKLKTIFFSSAPLSPEENLILYSPVEATVLSLRNSTDDSYKDPWDIVLDKDWGNFILLRDLLEKYIFIPKLKPGSLFAKPNERVIVGQPLAECGISKVDSKFHLYIQFQKGAKPSSDKIPFHLVNVLTYRPNKPREFHLFYYPVEGDYVFEAPTEHNIVKSIHLPPGLKRVYKVKDKNNHVYLADTQTGMTDSGQARIYVNKECSVAYELSATCLSYYDKQGGRNLLLDLYMLGIGVTPLTQFADTWTDEPSIHLWPLSFFQRIVVGIIHPLGLGCKSRYTRTWDASKEKWIQSAIHRAHIMPGLNWEATTIATLDPVTGLCQVQFEMFGKHWEITHESKTF